MSPSIGMDTTALRQYLQRKDVKENRGEEQQNEETDMCRPVSTRDLTGPADVELTCTE